ncbi:MAG: ATP F0F1 synthase subunit B [Rhodospirillales bacterium]|nr:ATP F0F1 synthase subunit B [Rhodospirillales bacterium]
MYELLLLLALILLGVVIWKTGLHRMITDILDGHAAKVRAELDEARALREEAATLLAEHQTRLADGEEHAQRIAAQAEAETKRLVARHKAELKASLKRREEQALARIAQEEAKALQDVRNRTASLAILTTRHLLREKMAGDRGQSLLDDAIGEVSRKLA